MTRKRRGLCPVCKNSIRVGEDGLLVEHTTSPLRFPGQIARSCTGGGKEPVDGEG